MTNLVGLLRACGVVFAEEEAALLREAAADEQTLTGFLNRRIQGEPLEQIVGFVEFCDDRYLLGPGVFIPRQRSALVVDEAVRLGGRLILDLCCGCGALGLAVSRRLEADLISADLDPRAIDYARANGAMHGYIGDLFDAVPDRYRGAVDLLIANTPYVPTSAIAGMPRESRDYEPRSTVDGGEDGMDIQRRLLAGASSWLSAQGHLLTETSRAQAPTLADLAREANLEPRISTDEESGATVLIARLPS